MERTGPASVCCFPRPVEGRVGFVVELGHALAESTHRAGIPATLRAGIPATLDENRKNSAPEQVFNLKRRELSRENIFLINVVVSFCAFSLNRSNFSS